MANTQKERLLEFASSIGYSKLRMCNKMGLSSAAISNMGDNLSVKMLYRIANAFPQLNQEWLKTGEGEMLLPVSEQKISIAMGGDNSQVGGSGNSYYASADTLELERLRKENEDLRYNNTELLSALEDAKIRIAKLEGKIELYKEILNK